MSQGGEVLPQALESIDPSAADRPDAVHVRARARLGTVLHDKWRLDALLGIGGMATVYAATHRNGSRAAVKILHPELAFDAFVRQRFLWEGRVANAVGHTGVVRVLDDDAAVDGSLFLVTELLEGETLEQRRQRHSGRLSQKEVLLVADQLLSVLGAVHAHNIVHRDLKPENVFLTRTGHIKVLDFGIARLSELSTPSSMTQAGLTVGTPAFMAPEQARGLSNEVDAASDLWACSALMFHLLSGKHVHEGRTLNEQLMHAMTRPAARLVSVAPDVAPQIRQIVDRGLTYAKAGRWPNARAMQEAVRRAYEELYGSTTLAAEELAVDPSSAAPPPGIGADTSSGSAVEPGAGPPYARSRVALRTGLRLYQLARARPGPTAAVGAAIVALASLLAFASLRPTAPAEAEVATPDVPPAVSSHTVAAPPPVGVTNHVPEVAATDLPVANDPPEAESASHRAWAPTPAVDTTVDCHPPYVVDAVTGKKQWKLECL